MTTDEMETKKYAMNITNQIFDYLIENGIQISVEQRQSLNDKIDEFNEEIIATALEKQREDTRLLKAIAHYALVVMTELAQKGEKIVGHLSDTDDNPGQALRCLLLQYGKTLDNTLYDFLKDGTQIYDGGYTDNDELIDLAEYKTNRTPQKDEPTN